MELGSPEHKQILMQGIIKVSVKIATLGLILGSLLMIPSLLRVNTFSNGLLYLGIAVLIGTSLYSLILAFRKYQKIIKPFDQQYATKDAKEE